MTICLKCCGYDMKKHNQQYPTTIYQGKTCSTCGKLLDIKLNDGLKRKGSQSKKGVEEYDKNNDN